MSASAQRTRRAWRRLAAAAVVAMLPSCSCGEIAGEVLTLYSDLAYTPDGAALVLDANDGLYLASPPDASPKLVSSQRCTAGVGTVSCLRFSPDGKQIAMLARTASATERDLYRFGVAPTDSGPIVPEHLAGKVYDAAFSPDSAELVWAKAGPAEGSVALYRRAEGGVEQELVRSIPLDPEEVSSALEAAVLARVGLVYPRRVGESVEIWFKPYDDRAAWQLGLLPVDCAGTSLSRCVFASLDGTSLVWQEKDSAIIHVYRVLKDVDLPLGQGYGFAFTQSGSFVLRMMVGPDAANVQNVDTAVVARRVVGATAAQLSFDGELISYLAMESRTEGTWRLFSGPSRQDGRDRDLGVFAAGPVRPLIGMALGLADLDYSLTGDGRYVVLAARGADDASAKIFAVSSESGEQKELATMACSSCCATAPAGALLMCLPEMEGGSASDPIALEIYDPTTGLKTVAARRAIDAGILLDGSGVAVLDADGTLPTLKVATKDGRIAEVGTAIRFALSPDGQHVAYLSELGSVKVANLP